jgi:hypothetical protein
MSWMKFVYRVSILGDDKLFAQKVEHAQKSAKKSIEYRGEKINLDEAIAITQYLDQYNKTTDDLFRR